MTGNKGKKRKVKVISFGITILAFIVGFIISFWNQSYGEINTIEIRNLSLISFAIGVGSCGLLFFLKKLFGKPSSINIHLSSIFVPVFGVALWVIARDMDLGSIPNPLLMLAVLITLLIILVVGLILWFISR